MLIDNEEKLARFRETLTGKYGLQLVREYLSVLVGLAVGVGKSVFQDRITEEAIRSGEYDLVIVLAPDWRILRERKRPEGVKCVYLRPRPARKCGKRRNTEWEDYEYREMAALGRRRICRVCRHQPNCRWLTQYGRGLDGVQVVYAAQQQLLVSPMFIAQVQERAGAQKVLVLLDESDILFKSQERTLSVTDLRKFQKAMDSAKVGSESDTYRRWQEWLNRILQARTNDLQSNNWLPPRISSGWAAQVQRSGMQLFGEQYRFVGYQCLEFGLSLPHTRLRDAEGNVAFGVRPYLGERFMLFSGTADTRLASFRCGRQLYNPFSEYEFRHKGTTFYNLNNGIGAERNFAKNVGQILEFFAHLISRSLKLQKRVLLVSKKNLKPTCAEWLTNRLAELGHPEVQIIPEKWDPTVLEDPNAIPMIHYGVVGINLFEHFDVAYCLNSYNVNDQAVYDCLQDAVRNDLRRGLIIKAVGKPARRTVILERNPDGATYDVDDMAQLALEQVEQHTVIQAIGRVRFCTRPRKVWTFQRGGLPGITYDFEFSNLKDAREILEIPTRKEYDKFCRITEASLLNEEGLAVTEIAEKLGVCVEVAKRYLREADPDRKSV